MIAAQTAAQAPQPPKPPKLTVTAAGVSQVRSAAGRTFITYGVAVTNRSRTVDAVGVTVNVTVLDSARAPIASDSQKVVVIPRGATFYVGGEINSPLDVPLVSVRAAAKAKLGAKIGLRLIQATHITAGEDTTSGFGGWRVTAVITNRYRVPLSSYGARACAVVVAGAKIVGGDCVDIGEALRADRLAPHATGALEFSNSDFPDVGKAITGARISVDPGAAALPKAVQSKLYP